MQLWKAVEHASASQSTNSVWFIRYRASVATRYSLRISLTHDQSMELVNLTSEPWTFHGAPPRSEAGLSVASSSYRPRQPDRQKGRVLGNYFQTENDIYSVQIPSSLLTNCLPRVREVTRSILVVRQPWARSFCYSLKLCPAIVFAANRRVARLYHVLCSISPSSPRMKRAMTILRRLPLADV